MKLQKIYMEVRGTDVFNMLEEKGTVVSKPDDAAQRTAAVLQAIYSVPELSATAGVIEKSNAFNCRVKVQGRMEEDESEDGIDDDFEAAPERKMDTQMGFGSLGRGFRGKRIQSAGLRKKRFE